MSSIIQDCEKTLAALHGRKHCVLTGRGATALWATYSTIPPDRPKILLPAMVCLSPMFCVHYADKIPVFADVQESDGTIDPVAVESLLSSDDKIGAVLAVHLYGHPASMEKLQAICRRHDVLLIEDAAQSMGGRFSDNRLLGSVGDVSILSFGHTKILDIGGGGALLTDDDRIAGQTRELVAPLPETSPENKQLSQLYGKLYYPIWEAGRYDPRFFTLFDNFPELFKPLYFSRIQKDTAAAMLNAAALIEEEVKARIGLAREYEQALGGYEHVRLMKPDGPGVPWRMTFRFNAALRDSFLDRVRQAGFDISSWYPLIVDWTPSGREQGREAFPVASMLEKEVVNLWVTDEYRQGRGEALIQTIKSIMEDI